MESQRKRACGERSGLRSQNLANFVLDSFRSIILARWIEESCLFEEAIQTDHHSAPIECHVERKKFSLFLSFPSLQPLHSLQATEQNRQRMVTSTKRPRIALARVGTAPPWSFNNADATTQGVVLFVKHTSNLLDIVLITPYPEAMAFIEVRGELGNQLRESNRIATTDRIRLILRGGERQKMEDGPNERPRCRITYEGEIEGWIRRKGEEREEHFSLGEYFLEAINVDRQLIV